MMPFALGRIGLMALVLAGSAARAADEDIVSVMSRMTLVVKDAEASKRFYAYALGYEVLGDRLVDNPVVKTQMGLDPSRTVRFVILRSSHVIAGKKREGAQLGLIQVGNPDLPIMHRPGKAGLAVGETMMAVRTTNIAMVHQRLKELGAKIVLQPMVSPDGRETELAVHDPDGVRIHVVQRPDREIADRPAEPAAR
jgi:catechol 2,3-dioxygenase-like lactoylglutathione lyase family enzyme